MIADNPDWLARAIASFAWGTTLLHADDNFFGGFLLAMGVLAALIMAGGAVRARLSKKGEPK